MKYYLLKVDDNDNWYASPFNGIEGDNAEYVKLYNFEDSGDFIKREVRVNIEENN